jgi:hypothetical protein
MDEIIKIFLSSVRNMGKIYKFQALLECCWNHNRVDRKYNPEYGSLVDPWHLGTDPDIGISIPDLGTDPDPYPDRFFDNG